MKYIILTTKNKQNIIWIKYKFVVASGMLSRNNVVCFNVSQLQINILKKGVTQNFP